MKRVFFTFLMVCAGLLWAGTNILPNEYFLKSQPHNAKSPVEWYGVLEPGCGIDTVETPEPGVANSVRIAGKSRLESYVKVKPGHVYNCSWWLKTKDFNWKTEAAFQVIWTHNKGQYLMTTWKGQPCWNMKLRNIHGIHDWTRFELNGLQAPPDADGACIRILQVFESSGECWYSKLRMEEAPQGNPFENRIAAVPPCSAKIDMNNGFDESLWSQSSLLTDYLTPISGASCPFKSETRLMADNDAIWILFRNYQDGVDKLRDKDFKLGNGYCVELFLLPPEQKYEYHAIISVKETLFTCRELVGDQSWPMTLHPWENNGIQYKVRLLKDSWQVLARVPFAAMGYKSRPANGEEWKANFCRTVGEAMSADSSWSFLKDERFQNAPCFGKIRFVGQPQPQVRKVNFSLDDVTAEITNVTAKPMEVTASIVSHSAGSCNVVEEKQIKIAPGENAICQVKAPVKSADLRYLEVRADGELVGKYSGLPSQEVLSFYVFDPENIRTQTLYLATDTPFFLAFSMRHNFPAKNKNDRYNIIERSDRPFDLYMEVPASLNIHGISFDGIDWMKRWITKAQKVSSSADGKMVTYKMEMPCILNWSPHGFMIFYDCNAKEGLDLKGSYYFTNRGVAMPRHEMNFRTMKIGKVKRPFKHLVYEIDLLSAQTLYNWLPKETVKRYLEFGMNRIELLIEATQSQEFYQGDDPRSNEQIYDLIVAQARKCPHPVYFCTLSTSANMMAWQMTRSDPDSWAKTIDGSKMVDYNNFNMLCPSYRGKLYHLWRDRLMNSSAIQKYKCTWLAADMEIFSDKDWNRICFCERCKAGFPKFCRENGYAQFADVDVQALLKAGKTPGLREVWGKYMNSLYVDSVMTTVNVVRKSLEGCKSTSPFPYFIMSDWTTPASPIGKSLELYEISEYFTPDLNYKKLMGVVQKWPNDIHRFVGCGTLGQTPECPDFFVTEKEVKDTLYESTAFGMRGMLWFYFPFNEPRRMHSIVKGLNAILPVEDLVINGKLRWDFACDNNGIQVTDLATADERIVAVRAYNAKADQKGTIFLKDINAAVNVYDLETGAVIDALSPAKSSFTATAPKGHCRLLYIGTAQQWEKRNR